MNSINTTSLPPYNEQRTPDLISKSIAEIRRKEKKKMNDEYQKMKKLNENKKRKYK
jgi:hypothetical protein